MGITAVLNRWEKKFAWSLLGFVLAIGLGAVSVYTEFFRNNSPLLEFELLGSTPVLDVHENVPELEVLYRNEDISKTGQSLSVIVLRVANRGPANILKNSYDDTAPVGVTIHDATLIRADVAAASNDYLGSTVAARIKPPSGVVFDPVILETNEWYVVKLLVIHKTGANPTLLPSGKIAGMHGIGLISVEAEGKEQGFLHRTLSGNVPIQIARSIIYSLALLVVLLAVIGTTATLSEAITNRKRRRLLEKFKKRSKLLLGDKDQIIFELYIDHGPGFLRRIEALAAKPDRAQRQIKRYLERQESEEQKDPIEEALLPIEVDNGIIYPPNMIAARFGLVIPVAIDSELVREVDGEWQFDQDRLKVVTSLIEFLDLMDADGN